MTEYIDRKKAIDALHQHVVEPAYDSAHKESYLAGYNAALEKAELYVIDIPTADFRPERHGCWIPIFENAADALRGVAMTYKCSQCGNTAKDETYSHAMGYEFCPRCGARMDGNG